MAGDEGLFDVPVPAAYDQGGLFVGDGAGEDSFRSVTLKTMYSPDDRPFDTFYQPLLARATSYDRAVGYWSGQELKFAAQGTAYFLTRGGKMRLIVGAQLNDKDVNAVLEGEPLGDVLAARMLADPALEGAKIVQSNHLSVLAWMVANSRLEIRVGVPIDKQGNPLTHKESGRYFHTKYGIFTDRYGNKVAFSGSNNASVTAWVRNHETFDAYRSWRKESWEDYGEPKESAFRRHWEARPDEGWAVLELPEAVRRRLTQSAPDRMPAPDRSQAPAPELDEEPSEEASPDDDLQAAWEELIVLRDAPQTNAWAGVATAFADPLPHQAELIHRVVSSYPRGYLFADEVGLGKTIEAGLVLRELFTSGRAKKALLLVPASVMKQWQEELHEKMNLDVARFDKGGFVDRFDQPIPIDSDANPWSAAPIVLASSHLARRRSRRNQILEAGPWDVVLVDEAHHARRRGSRPTDTPNSLLLLLQEMKKRGSWGALYLASATPMQMYPHEAWDLIELLSLPGKWGDSADWFTKYFTYLGDNPKNRGWQLLCQMLGDYFSDPDSERDDEMARSFEQDPAIGWANAYLVTELANNAPGPDLRAQFPNELSAAMDKWLRRHTPMRDRVFRNTRQTMRDYQDAGIIDPSVIIPHRHVEDVFIDLEPNERKLYERIEEYIRKHYNAYRSDKTTQALGFIMTVYRRRLTSSFEAIKRSLRLRLTVLEEGKGLADLLAEDDAADLDASLFDPEAFDVSADKLKAEINELRSFVNDLDSIVGEDTKAARLISDLEKTFRTSYDSAVVFTQYTATMDYVRERLVRAGYRKLGCYSGRGGELYDPDTSRWVGVSKAEIKTKFRAGDIDVLIGTDSMSEGLNLQTSGRLINYDMPWNLMRVEQRIGRVDRIGATYENLHISNYFYADTVEEQVYKGIKEDYDDFVDIVGGAAPVLGTVERVIEELALAQSLSPKLLEQRVDDLRHEADEVNSRPVKLDDLGAPTGGPSTVHEPPDLSSEVDLDTLEQTLTANVLTATRLTPHDERPNVYRLALDKSGQQLSFGAAGMSELAAYAAEPDTATPVTFSPKTWDESDDEDLVLLTYGTPELAAILPSGVADDQEEA